MTFPFKPVSENATAGRASRCRSSVNSGLFLIQPAEGRVVFATRGSQKGF